MYISMGQTLTTVTQTQSPVAPTPPTQQIEWEPVYRNDPRWSQISPFYMIIWSDVKFVPTDTGSKPTATISDTH